MHNKAHKYIFQPLLWRSVFLNLYSERVSSWTFTLKERLPALRGFSVRVESQGLESGTELVREECLNTNLFTCLLNGHFAMIHLGKWFPLLSFANVCINVLSGVFVYTVYSNPTLTSACLVRFINCPFNLLNVKLNSCNTFNIHDECYSAMFTLSIL